MKMASAAASYSSSIILLLIGLAAVLCTVAARVAPLANCPARCHCDDETLVVSCSEGHLDVLPIALNPSIQRLEIKKNRIRIVDSSLQFYSELSYLDLSHNRLFGLPAKTFYYQKKLLELHLNHNQITAVTNKTFHGLGALSVLNLRSNQLTAIGAGTFAALTQLQELNLGQNRIATVDARAFEALASLRVLYLDDNSLTVVPTSAFAMVPVLAELFLGVNQLGSIAPGAFESLRSLNRLELPGVQLRNVSLETFRGLENLRHMDLTGNRLQRIPTVELSTLTRLEELKLGQNEFNVIAEAAFVGMTNLRRLDISGSTNLTHVQSGAFSANTNLESVILASNKRLSNVHEGAFGGLPHLRHVVLRDNAIETLSEGMFPWSQLTTFDLAENPIRCDCAVMWLRNVLHAVHQQRNSNSNATAHMTPEIAAHEQILCAAPAHMHNAPLRLLSPEVLGCTHLDAHRQAVVGLILVASAACITAVLLIVYKCRATIGLLLRGQWTAAKSLGSGAGHKQSDYMKTFTGGEDYARFPHPCASLSVHPSLYNYPQLQQFDGACVVPIDDYQKPQQTSSAQPQTASATITADQQASSTGANKTVATTNSSESKLPHMFQLSQEHLIGTSNKAFSLFPHNFGTPTGGTVKRSQHLQQHLPAAMPNAYTASPPLHLQQQQQQHQIYQTASESHYTQLQLDYDYAVAVHRNGSVLRQHAPQHHRHHHNQHHHTMAMPGKQMPSVCRPLGPAPALPARNGTVTLPKRTYH